MWNVTEKKSLINFYIRNQIQLKSECSTWVCKHQQIVIRQKLYF